MNGLCEKTKVSSPIFDVEKQDLRTFCVNDFVGIEFWIIILFFDDGVKICW